MGGPRSPLDMQRQPAPSRPRALRGVRPLALTPLWIPLEVTTTRFVEKWVDEVARLTEPSRVVWCDGSKPEYDRLIEEMLRDGTLLPLNQRTYPNCYLHRSHPSDVARTEQLTFICTRERDEAGPKTPTTKTLGGNR